MVALVAQPERVRHRKGSVREHRRLQPVNASALEDVFGVIGAHGQHLDAARIELVSKFFPSP